MALNMSQARFINAGPFDVMHIYDVVILFSQRSAMNLTFVPETLKITACPLPTITIYVKHKPNRHKERGRMYCLDKDFVLVFI